jgi:hypothetical protein
MDNLDTLEMKTGRPPGFGAHPVRSVTLFSIKPAALWSDRRGSNVEINSHE